MIDAILSGLAADHPDIVVVHGAARGADQMAGQWADKTSTPCDAYPADWDKHGKSAGPVRNQQMLDSGIDLVVAFRCEGVSSGTDHMVAIATKAGVPTYVVRRPS